MPRLRLLATILATMLLASVAVATAEESIDPSDEQVEVAHHAASTLSCSLVLPGGVGGCFYELPVVVAGDWELSLGVDVQGDAGALLSFLRSSNEDDLAAFLHGSHAAPFLTLAWYGEWDSAWLEMRMPRLTGVPILGDPSWLRVGFTYRFSEERR